MDIEAFSEQWQRTMVQLLSLQIRIVERNKFSANWLLPSNTFMFVIHGKGQTEINESQYAIERHLVLHGCKGDSIRFKVEEPVHYYSIEYMPFVAKVGEEDGEALGIRKQSHLFAYGFQPVSPLALYDLMERMHSNWNSLEPSKSLQVVSHFYEWLYELLHQLRQSEPALPSMRVRQAVHYMQNHYSKPLLLEQISGMVGCSPRYLNQLFRSCLGTSPMQLLAGIRMERAMELLLGTREPLQQIAERIGYTSGYSLSRHFKKVYGASPESFRKGEQPAAKSNAYSDRLVSPGGHQEIHSRQGSPPVCSRGKQAAHTRRIRTDLGEVEAPLRPQRVVVDWQLGGVVALGITPVGSPHSLVHNSRLLHHYMNGESCDIGNHNRIAMERVWELEPDLIITSSTKLYASYARIAPTVYYSPSDGSSVTEQMRAMGHILNREEQAEAWLEGYAKRAFELRRQAQLVIPANKTFTIIDPNWGEEMMVIGNTGHRGGKTVYELLNQRPPSPLSGELMKCGTGELNLSWKEAERHVGDYLLVMLSEHGSDVSGQMDWQSWAGTRTQVLTFEWNKFFLSDPFSSLLQGEEIIKKLRD